MNKLRRQIIQDLTLAIGFAAMPLKLLAAAWNSAAFEAKEMRNSLDLIGAGAAVETDQIRFKAPEIAENGAIVPIEIESSLPGTETIFVLAERNPQPLAASFTFLKGSEPFVSTRIKMSESSRVMVVVKSGARFYSTSREIKVTIGGCGG
jgi:sulfur-oxidizing protein SoxY